MEQSRQSHFSVPLAKEYDHAAQWIPPNTAVSVTKKERAVRLRKWDRGKSRPIAIYSGDLKLLIPVGTPSYHHARC